MVLPWGTRGREWPLLSMILPGQLNWSSGKTVRDCVRVPGENMVIKCWDVDKEVWGRPVGCWYYVDIQTIQNCEVLYYYSVWPQRKDKGGCKRNFTEKKLAWCSERANRCLCRLHSCTLWQKQQALAAKCAGKIYFVLPFIRHRG